MLNQIRMDRMSFGKAERLPSGYLRVPITATRVGIFVYRKDDGGEWRELRTPDEVFKAESMATLQGVPATNGHPADGDGLLTATNTRDHMVGFTSDKVLRIDELLGTSMTITDAPTINEVLAGDKVEVSAGYTCDLELKAGTYRGQRYDAIQRNIRYNHVAICKTARGGSQVRIHLDSAERVLRLDSILGPDEINIGDTQLEKSVIIDGVEYKVTPEAYAAISGKFNKDSLTITGLTDKVKAADDEKAKVQARADSLESDNKKLKEAAEKSSGIRLDSDEFRAAVRKRVELERFAESRLDADDITKLSEREIIVGLIKLDSPDFKDEGKSDAYLQARLDHMLETESDDDAEVRQDADDADGDDGNAYDKLKKGAKTNTRNDSRGRQKSHDEIRQDSIEKAQNAWKNPIGANRKAR